MGFEPTTSAVTGRRSNQLSHTPIKARDGIRTRDPRLGKAILHH